MLRFDSTESNVVLVTRDIGLVYINTSVKYVFCLLVDVIEWTCGGTDVVGYAPLLNGGGKCRLAKMSCQKWQFQSSEQYL